MIDLAQEITYEAAEAESEEAEVPEALTVCRGCGHLVPKTMLCLWCGSPIMFKMPRQQETEA